MKGLIGLVLGLMVAIPMLILFITGAGIIIGVTKEFIVWLSN